MQGKAFEIAQGCRMKVRIRRRKRGAIRSFDVGTRSIPLGRKTLRIAGPAFEKALRKFGELLCKQRGLSCAEFVSIEYHGVSD